MPEVKLKQATICVVTQQLKNPLSGVGVHSRILINQLILANYKVLVITPKSEVIPQLPVMYYQVSDLVLADNQARWFLLALSFKKMIARTIRENHIDLIHFTDARESFFFRDQIPTVGNINDTYSAQIYPLGYYARYYSDWLARWGYYHIVHQFEKIALNRLTTVIANSQYTAGVIREQYRLPDRKVRVCYKSIDLAPYRNVAAQRLKQAPHQPRVLFVGGNMQRKGLPVLIQAAHGILQVEPDTCFWVVGRDRSQAVMEALCREHGVREHFQFMGWKSQEELLEIYPNCDIFAMPSLVEALGVVFLEAMAAGLVPVGTRVGGIPEIIENGVNGLLVTPDSPDELAHAILDLLQHPVKMKMLKKNGAVTLKKFSVDRMMAGTYDVYGDAIQPFKSPSAP